MWPSDAEPAHGVFVQEQVEDLRSTGVVVTVLAFDGRRDWLEYARAIRRVRRATAKGGYDLVHAHYGLTGLVALGQRRIPVAVTFHGSDVGFKRWQVPISRFVSRHAALPIFVSPRGAQRLGVANPTIIPAAVDTARFNTRDRSAARRLLGWNEDDVVIVFPGDPRKPVKNYPLFLRTVEELQRRGVYSKTVTLQDLERERVSDILCAADVSVMTSHAEGSPVTVRESLASGTPVVSVDVGDVREVLADLPGCAVVEPDPRGLASAVVAALNSPRNVGRLRAAAAPTSRERVQEQLLDAYAQVISPPRKARRAIVAWNASDGRSRDLATALDAETVHVHAPSSPVLAATLVRYVAATLRTAASLAARRPSTVIVANPPIALGLLAHAYASLRRATFVLDSHTGAFGFKGDVWARRLLPVHRYLARRAAVVMVASEEAAALVRRWGGRPIIFFEPPLRSAVQPGPRTGHAGRTIRVAWAGMAAADEPLDVLLAAIRRMPDYRFDLMVDRRRLPDGFEAALPANATAVGFLHGADYYARLSQADVVVALSTASASVMRLACEAVWLEIPLVVSETPSSVSAFPHSTWVATTADDIAQGVQSALDDPDREERLKRARLFQTETVARQLRDLNACLDVIEAKSD
jgi:glycosyltransferase involved in cell wall biosynthesis